MDYAPVPPVYVIRRFATSSGAPGARQAKYLYSWSVGGFTQWTAHLDDAIKCDDWRSAADIVVQINGAGFVARFDDEMAAAVCPDCLGTGRILDVVVDHTYVMCSVCDGDGRGPFDDDREPAAPPIESPPEPPDPLEPEVAVYTIEPTSVAEYVEKHLVEWSGLGERVQVRVESTPEGVTIRVSPSLPLV